MIRQGSLLLLACLLLVACGDDDGGTGNNNACPVGYAAEGPACVPVFDDCAGPTEIPVLGGGCLAVGVTYCATGLFEPDGEDGCAPILPAQTCPPGTMPVIGQTECQPVGVLECADGFESDGAGGCDAILPPAPCPPGSIAVLGYTTCQPLGDCGTSTFGNIQDDGITVYVDQTADATSADGSVQAPFVTIGEALAVVVPGGRIAVAEGEYLERVTLSDPLRLAGRCAERVTMRGPIFLGSPTPPLTIGAGGSGSTVSGFTLTGPGKGLQISGAVQVSVEEVEVTETGDVGISASAQSEVHLTRVKVVRGSGIGLLAEYSTLEAYESVVRDTQPRQSDGRFGRGINAECGGFSGFCGSLEVTRSLVSGNRSNGIFTAGPDTTVTDTVVGDTLPDSDGSMGRGITASCSADLGVCGRLDVVGSVLARNRSVGVYARGVDVTVTSTVVRDTQLRQSDSDEGHGVGVHCDETLDQCGTLSVTNSKVAGNRTMGIFSLGVDTDITASLVRDTAPDASGDAGHGVRAQCDPLTRHCGRLTVSASLVEANTAAGVSAIGADLAVRSTVVSDTLPMPSGVNGPGIAAQCATNIPRCGTLEVTSSLITGNTDVGISAYGVEATVTAAVVRDTVSGGDGAIARGIEAFCEPELGVCGRLIVAESLIAGNRSFGISLGGVDAQVVATVIRDTLPSAQDGTSGRGISAQCQSSTGSCGHVSVVDSLVSGNRDIGVVGVGSELTVTRSVVRQTLPNERDGTFGVGIGSRCDPSTGTCGSTTLSQSLIADNRSVGILSFGVDTTLTGSLVRDTLPETTGGHYGRGISAQCDPMVGYCGSLSVAGSVIRSSEQSGIFIHGVPAVLEGVAVLDTVPNTSGFWEGQFGQSIWAMCDLDLESCSTLQLTSCLLESSHKAGLAMQGVSGFMRTSAIRQVLADTRDGKYGYGAQLEGVTGLAMISFNVIDCSIQDAKLAGILYYRAQGTLTGSVVSGGENSVIMNEGSAPTILDDNALSGTVESDPIWANLAPSPAPPPALPD
ncbi:MAG: hypothetical protein ABI333_30490 [bacterium]